MLCPLSVYGPWKLIPLCLHFFIHKINEKLRVLREFDEFWYVVKDLINFIYYCYYFSYPDGTVYVGEIHCTIKMFLCISYNL